MSMNTLSADGSCYVIAGREVPSVTMILQAAGLIDFSRVPIATLDYAAWRGSAVRRACWYDDEGDLDENTVPEEARPYLDCWRRAKQLLGWHSTHREPLLCDPLYLYVGRPDRLGRDCVLDLKTGVLLPSAKWQTAAYAHLAGMGRRIVVRLRACGDPQILELPAKDQRRDYTTFAAAVKVWWARKEHGLIP